MFFCHLILYESGYVWIEFRMALTCCKSYLQLHVQKRLLCSDLDTTRSLRSAGYSHAVSFRHGLCTWKNVLRNGHQGNPCRASVISTVSLRQSSTAFKRQGWIVDIRSSEMYAKLKNSWVFPEYC